MNSSKFQKEVLDRLDEIISLLEKEEKPQVKKVLVENTLATPSTTSPIGSTTFTIPSDGYHPIPPKGYKLVPDGYHYEYHLDPSDWYCGSNLNNKIN